MLGEDADPSVAASRKGIVKKHSQRKHVEPSAVAIPYISSYFFLLWKYFNTILRMFNKNKIQGTVAE